MILCLVSKNFNVLSKKEIKKCAKRLKVARFTELKQKELNQKLKNVLNKWWKDKEILQEAVKLILAGANVDTQDDFGKTALMLAVFRGNDVIEVIQTLINLDANVNIIINRQTALIWAVLRGDPEIVKLLINAKATLNFQDEFGRNALMEAVLNGYTEIVILLLDAGAELNAKDNNGYTALTLAVSKDYTEIAKLLINAGADLNIEDRDGQTALMWAKDLGNTEIVELLESKSE